MTRSLPLLTLLLAMGLPLAAPAANTTGGVIFNEHWINDDTAYASIGGREIWNDWVELLVIDPSGVDLRGWRLTNNQTKTQQGVIDDGDGSLIFPDNPALANIPSTTCILIIASDNATNEATFPADDLDPSDGQMILSVTNDNLDTTTDPGFSMRTSDEALVLLAPGATPAFADDIGVDFIAENAVVTPATFGVAVDGVVFAPAFSGIGSDDGAVFTNSAGGGFNNDNGADAVKDNLPGPGGWIVDPPANYTGDDTGGSNILTPGAPNFGQDLSSIQPATPQGLMMR
ncbi:hypothetical protein JXA47_13205 [Candidatus Sumerlaeota bacterium]|nr:hypothetical protein [Candidatus Sumerlaeota bacterium]